VTFAKKNVIIQVLLKIKSKSMNNTNMANNTAGQKTTKKSLGAWLYIFISLAVIIILASAYFLINSLPQGEKPSPVESSGKSDFEKADNQDDGLPDEIYAYIGTVTAVGENQIVINAPANGNYLLTDTELRVMVDNDTELVNLIIPKTLEGVKPGEAEEWFEKQEIKFDQIKAGDKVTVIAGENVKGKTEFKALRVEVNVIK